MTDLQQRISEDVQDSITTLQGLMQQIGKDVESDIVGSTDFYHDKLRFAKESIERSLAAIRRDAGGIRSLAKKSRGGPWHR